MEKYFSFLRYVVITLILITGMNLATKDVHALGTLANLKDTITTSRPSASSPLTADEGTSSSIIDIANNGSRYFASDSAKIVRTSSGAQIVGGLFVASQSADLTDVYLTTTTGTAAQAATDVLVTNITALHTIQFTTATAIPTSGTIVITFPGGASNIASPSATTFSFNGMSTSNPSDVLFNNATCSSVTVSAPTITCTLSGGVSASTTVTVLIGCTSQSSGACTVQAPRLINPIKTNSAGNRDLWTVNVKTTDGAADLDTGKALIGIIESVEVKAAVDNSLTFTITGGFSSGTAINNGNSTGCTNSETVTSSVGATSTSTLVDLGILTTSAINIHAQRINITTNGLGGYTLTATSSGHLINNATGYFIPDSTTPTAMTAGTAWFGLHACGLDVASGTWGTGATGGGAGALYGWPTKTTAVTLATDSTGPVDTSLATGNGITSVEYAATVSAAIPAGAYQAYVTYVATPTF